MAIIRLTEGGREIPLTFSMLKALAENCPEGPHGEDLARELLALGIQSITGELIDKDFLSAGQRDAIWENGDLDIRRRLLRVSDFLSRLTDAQARDIVEQDDVEMLKAVAEWSERLYPGSDSGLRISGAAADSLMEHIRTHANPAVRAALAENLWTPPRFYPPLADYIRNGYDMRHYPFASLGVEDVAALAERSREVLKELARRVEDIADADARKAALSMLAAHPDPDVRLALAENADARRLAHALLVKDPDPGIAAMAAADLPEA